MQQIKRKKYVVVHKIAYYISGRYNEIEEEVRLDKIFVLGSCPKLLHGFSFGCPWFNCLASLQWSRTVLHPVDICFLYNWFRAFLPSYFLDALFSKGGFRSWVQQDFVPAFICQKLHYQSTIFMLQFVASANMLWALITPLDMIVSKAENKMLMITKC